MSGLMETHSDIMRAEEKNFLTNLEGHFHKVIENFDAVFWMNNLEGTAIVYVSPAYEKIFGRTCKSLRENPESWTDAIHPEDRGWMYEGFKRAAHGNYNEVYRIIRPDGSIRWVYDRTFLVRDVSGRVYRTAGLAEDATNFKLSEESMGVVARQQAAVAELGHRALSTDISVFMNEAAALIANVFRADCCSILEYLPENNAFLFCGGSECRKGIEGTVVPAGKKSLAGFTVLSGKPVLVQDFASEPRFEMHDFPCDCPMTSGMSVIIHGKEKPFGVIEVYSLRPRVFTKDDVAFCLSAANILAIAVQRGRMEQEIKNSREQLRNFSMHLQLAREDERAAISREIHDELGQVLAMLKMQLMWLSGKLRKDQKALKKRVKAMTALFHRTVNTVQKLIVELRPAMLDDAGLVAAMEWQLKEFKKHTGIEYTAKVPDDFPLDSPRATALIRILQEALTNTARHAKATQVEVELKREAHHVKLCVKDNGKGFEKARITDRRSFGFVGMRERALYWGGEVILDAVQGRGTTVTVQIPLEGNDIS